MDENGLHEQLRNLQTQRVGGQHALHKPLLLLWLFGRYLDERSSETSFEAAEGPLDRLIDRFSLRKVPASQPFWELERTLWTPTTEGGSLIADTPHSAKWLRDNGAQGSLRDEVVNVLDEPRGIFTAADVLYEYFAPDVVDTLRSAVRLVPPVFFRPAALKREAPTTTTRLPQARRTKSREVPIEFERSVRNAVFKWLEDLTAQNGGPIPFAQMANFIFDGTRIPILNPQSGIHKPAKLGSALSIKTVYRRPTEERPYEDELDESGRILRYKYRGEDPLHSDNVALRNAMERKLPLFWLKGVDPHANYETHFPLWLTAERPEQHLFEVSFEGPPKD
ncbi:hypothetical protein ACFQ05_14060 [Amycolatopsis umgeniensis]|uniref:ScoMcrA-like DNA sulfur-binding domain-containing protein n=1 Tax=Amycolatopsis umgeniensis TaxID=336628 RepID=A0A841B2V1_9PSEU|nr:hypothetical protein [Amycolatopsis umgeniensis]MBB5854426.1 hypothetical protein [Amycolatopsis umgeniensis]